MKPYANIADFEKANPIWRFSPYLWGRVSVLRSLRATILQDLDKGFGDVVNASLISDAEASLWLWLLGAYEMTRTMCQAKGCFSKQTADALQKLKHELAEARMPTAKMETPGRHRAVTSFRSPAGIDAKGKDFLVGDPNQPLSARGLLARFNDVISSIAPSDVLKPHESSYDKAS